MRGEDFEGRQIRLPEVTINLRIGGGGPPVLLLHGYPQTLAMWTAVAPILASTRTVVCADLRGYGDSGKPPCAEDMSTYSFRAMAQDQVAVMRALGWDAWDVVGHDRGARVGHRMALDHPHAVRSLAVLDVVPTLAMWDEVDRARAAAYWHWYFLSLPSPFPERIIGADPDYFFETCFETWGATDLARLDQPCLAEYRRCWRDPAMIAASCADYRAAAGIDILHDRADAHRRVDCPTLALWGADGRIAELFDVGTSWAQRVEDLECDVIPGGHFFVDQHPEPTARRISQFLSARNSAGPRG